MDNAYTHPDALFRRHACLKRLLGKPDQIDPQVSKLVEQDKANAEYDRLVQESLRLLDCAYLTGNDLIIQTAISLWNMSIDRRRHYSE